MTVREVGQGCERVSSTCLHTKPTRVLLNLIPVKESLSPPRISPLCLQEVRRE